ncbi:hypothetical protein T11_4119 [Trichinella zimbabwensis]|uniref:Uncharacterized protein n=1 Tax=Trichinella zimbabwensis TaxID=268475 RepID=A0A0V1GSQ3_9BILA|nr:hypothetical protein T11_4119 [Trichinella zimbabwensis]
MDSPDSSTSHGAHSAMVNSTGDWLYASLMLGTLYIRAVLTAPLTSPRFLQSCSFVVYATFRRPDQYRYHMICCKSASNTNGYGSSILGCRRTALDCLLQQLFNHETFSPFWEEKARVVNGEHAVHSVLAFCNGVWFYGSSILDPRRIMPLIEFKALGLAVVRSNREALPVPLIQAILHNRIAPSVALSSLTHLLSWSYVGIRSYEEAVTVSSVGVAVFRSIEDERPMRLSHDLLQISREHQRLRFFHIAKSTYCARRIKHALYCSSIMKRSLPFGKRRPVSLMESMLYIRFLPSAMASGSTVLRSWILAVLCLL